MPLQSTGPISLANIQAELGGTNPVSLSEYYSNATPTYPTAASNIPSIGAPISIGMFYGQAGPALYDFSSFNFTNAGVTGRSGPSLAQCQTAYSSASWTSNTIYFNVVNGKQQWTVPKSGNYSIIAAGAKGGSNTSTARAGFGGRVVQGTIALAQGQIVEIVVGQMGLPTSSSGGGGGGGGTYLFNTTSSNVIIVAGGGGGAGNNANGTAGVFSPSGTGAGGAAPSWGMGGSGGGMNSNGGSNGGGAGGLAFVNGSTGGTGAGAGGAGGFGGGGGASDQNGWSGGGGGGYTGGKGANSGYDSGGGGGTCFGSMALTDLGISASNMGYVYIQTV